MLLQSLFAWALALGSCIAQNSTNSTWPIHNNGLTTQIEWDHYSLIVNGERFFLWSGELHYWRIPVPELWIDVLQKVKAAGKLVFPLVVNIVANYFTPSKVSTRSLSIPTGTFIILTPKLSTSRMRHIISQRFSISPRNWACMLYSVQDLM